MVLKSITLQWLLGLGSFKRFQINLSSQRPFYLKSLNSYDWNNILISQSCSTQFKYIKICRQSFKLVQTPLYSNIVDQLAIELILPIQQNMNNHLFIGPVLFHLLNYLNLRKKMMKSAIIILIKKMSIN
ncbi:unnamed protein product [Paramecium pentaurelia]|uniref:Uncharacterized protein n=1 Tax=Paramecium pentaurelia TaxID=43138 RepID=A0A8S1VQH9_9CILI|nr:unnamed protein product [Paramecium pentaurelia]